MLSEIEQNLKILGITSFSQFKEGDITYWWQKKYMQISNKKLSKNKISDQLIELNLSKEFLDGIKFETIKDVFDKKRNINKFEKNTLRKVEGIKPREYAMKPSKYMTKNNYQKVNLVYRGNGYSKIWDKNGETFNIFKKFLKRISAN